MIGGMIRAGLAAPAGTAAALASGQGHAATRTTAPARTDAISPARSRRPGRCLFVLCSSTSSQPSGLSARRPASLSAVPQGAWYGKLSE